MGAAPISAQLAVLAAAPVVAGVVHGLLVRGFLASEAQSHARNGLAPRLRDLRSALGAGFQRRPARQLALGTLDRVLDGGIDLILHRPFFRPARGHRKTPTISARPRQWAA